MKALFWILTATDSKLPFEPVRASLHQDFLDPLSYFRYILLLKFLKGVVSKRYFVAIVCSNQTIPTNYYHGNARLLLTHYPFIIGS